MRDDWFNTTPCAFPNCQCKGFCVYSNEQRRAERLEQLRGTCTFPKCACKVGCGYMAYLYPARGALPEPPAPPPPPPRPAGYLTVVPPKVIAQADGKPCPYCGEAMTGAMHRPTRDHIHPLSKGGPDHPANVVIAGRSCNRDKGDMTLNEWRIELERAGDSRARRVAELHARMLERRPGEEEEAA